MEKEEQKGPGATCHADPEVASEANLALDTSAATVASQPDDHEIVSSSKTSVEKRSTAVIKKDKPGGNNKKKEPQTLPLQTSDEHHAVAKVTIPKDATPRLIHSSMLMIPMQIRYIVYGIVSSLLFMVLYNLAVEKLSYLYVPSTIYAVTYMVFIPIQHALASCMVFGWPDRYIASLTSNVPIGLTAIALGAYLTAYLDKIKFDESAESTVRRLGAMGGSAWLSASSSLSSSSEMTPPATTTVKQATKEGGEFYTSLVVLIVTSFWSFILAVIVNSPAEAPEKKQV